MSCIVFNYNNLLDGIYLNIDQFIVHNMYHH